MSTKRYTKSRKYLKRSHLHKFLDANVPTMSEFKPQYKSKELKGVIRRREDSPDRLIGIGKVEDKLGKK